MPREKLRYRLSKVILLCLIVVFGVHGIWYWLENKAFRSQIDALHAAGERIEIADFNTFVNPTDTDNAARFVDAAAAIIDDDSVFARSVESPPASWPVPMEEWAAIESAVDYYRPALKRVDQAVLKPRCEWNRQYVSPVFNATGRSELGRCTSVALLLITTSLVEHHHHNDGLSLRRLNQILFLSGACENTPDSVGHLRASGLVRSYVSRLQDLLPELSFDDADPTAVKTADVRDLIKHLVNESVSTEGLRSAFAGERMVSMDTCQSTTLNFPLMAYCLDPYLVRMARRQLDEQSAISAAAISSTDWPTASSKISQVQDQTSHSMYGSHRANLASMTKFHFLTLADRRLAAAALAVRLYRHDHQQNFPPTLTALVPKYLPSVPCDPMAPGAPAIQYRLTADNPIIYSVGEDGIDNGGNEAATSGQFYSINGDGQLDEIYHLASHPRHELSHNNQYYPGGFGR